jgi:GTP-binding protein HflX
VIVTDTVGFIRDLPPDLVAGFRATLEEIHDAHVLLHVADASSPDVEGHIEAVRDILAELGLDEKPEVLILNKCDRLDPAEIQGLVRRLTGTPISALDGRGVEDLLAVVEPIAFPEDPEGDERSVGSAVAVRGA